ncbi:hypothetical protein [Haloferula sp.]|uniref:hypothetical protein n=1 Tax=Haloferula sp. TaxID=2497595 RepID=UPI003C762394
MATKEELNRIFEEALKQPEAPIATAAPVKAASLAQPMAEAPAAEQTAVPTEAGKIEHAPVTETDPEFGALLEEREGRIKKKASRARWAVNLLLIGLFGGTATAFTVSPTLRGKVEHLTVSLKEGVEDVKMMGKGSENYDEALEEIGQRGNQIDEASRMMGVDPTTVDPGDDPNMLAEINQLAGEDVGLDSRLGKLQSLGKIGQAITGAEGPKTRKDFASPEVAAE